MSMIRTVKRENPFVQLDKEFIGNGNLSLKSTGLLTYILSKPDGWQIRMKDIQNKFTDGETSVRSAMNELTKQGYINRYRERNEDGTLGDYIYEVYERPEFNPKRENQVLVSSPKRDFPELDNPEQENHVHSNNDFSNNDFSNKNKEEEEEASQLQQLKFLFNDSFGHMNKTIENNIKKWLVKLPYEVIKHEIERAALKNLKSPWNYIETLLNEDEAQNLLSVEDINNKVVSFNEGKKKRTASRSKVIRKELEPDWYKEAGEYYGELKQPTNENKSERDLTEEQREVEEMLAAFRNS